MDAERPQHSQAANQNNEDDGDGIWTMRDLRVLHELQKPVAVVISGVYEDPHRYRRVLSQA